MGLRPNDRTDLYLAPVLLELDRRMQVLGAIDAEELARAVAVAANVETDVVAVRPQALLFTVTQGIDLRGWEASWDPRGLRVAHGEHSVVLGVPASFLAFRDGVAA